MLRQFLEAAILQPLAAALDVPNATLRVSLAQAQLLGLFVARRIINVAALNDADHDRLIVAVAPIIQRYLTGRLPD